MLSELFAELVIDFDDSDRAVQTDSCPRFTCASLHAYVPLDRSPKWFLNDNLYLNNNGDDKTSEISRNRAAFAYIHADYITAMDIYFHLLEKETSKSCNSSSAFSLIDSVICCGLKVAPVNGPQLLSLLQKLHTLVSTYDEQLQYWAQSLKVYFAAGTCTKDSLRNAILLCASVDLPEFWISIPKNIPNPSTNLRIGSLCRAVHILEKLSPSKAGFLDCNDLQLMKRELHGLCSKEKLSEAEVSICSDLVRTKQTKSKDTNHPHFCKGILKDSKTQDDMICEFIHRFHWLFSDMNYQV